MKVTVWGTRGSVAAPGPDTARYGGNTSCVEVRADDGTTLVLDAGTGVRRLGAALVGTSRRVDLLLTHLHMDHIQGLGFFAPLYAADLEVHIWGPGSTTLDLRTRLGRYMSPPLFPVRLRDLPCRLTLHQVPNGTMAIGPFRVEAALVCHPDPTVGYRISADGATIAYIPDHEPAIGLEGPPRKTEWLSGYGVAAGVDLLIHDGQYTDAEYANRIGWGHSSIRHAIEFAALAGARRLMLFHHDPEHDDAELDALVAEALVRESPSFPVIVASEGLSLDVSERE